MPFFYVIRLFSCKYGSKLIIVNKNGGKGTNTKEESVKIVHVTSNHSHLSPFLSNLSLQGERIDKVGNHLIDSISLSSLFLFLCPYNFFSVRREHAMKYQEIFETDWNYSFHSISGFTQRSLTTLYISRSYINLTHPNMMNLCILWSEKGRADSSTRRKVTTTCNAN